MIGPLILVIGLLGMWALVKGKARPVLDAIAGGQSSFITSLENKFGSTPLDTTTTKGVNQPAGNSSSGSSGPGGSFDAARAIAADIGTHSALVNGIVVTIDKTYAQASPSEKDAMNAFAHKNGG